MFLSLLSGAKVVTKGKTRMVDIGSRKIIET